MGYFAGTLEASRFSAPWEERMIGLFSPGSWVPDELAAAASFLLSLGLLASGLATGATALVAPEAGG